MSARGASATRELLRMPWSSVRTRWAGRTLVLIWYSRGTRCGMHEDNEEVWRDKHKE